LKAGDRVRITYRGRSVVGKVILASANGASLALEFEAFLGGYAGMIPVMRDGDGIYRDLIASEPVQLDLVQ